MSGNENYYYHNEIKGICEFHLVISFLMDNRFLELTGEESLAFTVQTGHLPGAAGGGHRGSQGSHTPVGPLPSGPKRTSFVPS